MQSRMSQTHINLMESNQFLTIDFAFVKSSFFSGVHEKYYEYNFINLMRLK